jgi:hypothetical protein
MIDCRLIHDEDDTTVTGVEFSGQGWKVNYSPNIALDEWKMLIGSIKDGKDDVLMLGDDGNTLGSVEYIKDKVILRACRYGSNDDHEVEINVDAAEFLTCLEKLFV